MDPTTLWAIQAESGGDLFLVAKGWCGSEFWTWNEVREEVRQRRLAVEAADVFLRVVESVSPAAAKQRVESFDQFFKQIDADRAAREMIERRGEALIHLLDGQPVRVEGASLVDAQGGIIEIGIQARRIDVGLRGPFTETPLPWPWEKQVWARPVGHGVWRRGRLRLADDSASFADEPTAISPDRGDSRPSVDEPSRSLERDILQSKDLCGKAMNAEVYARMLFAALKCAKWQPTDGSKVEDSQRSVPELMNLIVGTRNDKDWAWNSPTDMLDEEVLADLGVLGWEPERQGKPA